MITYPSRLQSPRKSRRHAVRLPDGSNAVVLLSRLRHAHHRPPVISIEDKAAAFYSGADDGAKHEPQLLVANLVSVLEEHPGEKGVIVKGRDNGVGGEWDLLRPFRVCVFYD
jgi:hypothetical protein